MTASRIYMVAAEPSGDLLACETVEALRERDPNITFAGIGGDQLASLGIQSPIDIAPLSILGLFEGLKAYGTVVKLADAAADDIIAFAPDAVVLVDSWGFMLRVAQRVRERAPHIKLIKLVGPQVWATRPGRAKTLAKAVDHLICIYQMEVPFYQELGLPVTVMGPPALSRTTPGDGKAFRNSMGLSDADELVLVLPGSRPSEVKRVAPELVRAAELIKQHRPKAQIVFAPALSVREQFKTTFPEIDKIGQLAGEDAKGADMMAAADYALACSGTVTTELAVQGTPFLVAYKTGWITWFLARYFLFKPEHITLLNIAADDQEVAPEFVQTKQTSQRMADMALSLIADSQKRADQIEAQNKALSRMREGEGAAPQIAAQTILDVISVPGSG